MKDQDINYKEEKEKISQNLKKFDLELEQLKKQ